MGGLKASLGISARLSKPKVIRAHPKPPFWRLLLLWLKNGPFKGKE